jgi:hypothetical protein
MGSGGVPKVYKLVKMSSSESELSDSDVEVILFVFVWFLILKLFFSCKRPLLKVGSSPA